LVVAAIGIVIGLPFFSTPLLDAISDAPPGELLGGTSTLGFRQRMWGQALQAIHDYPFTGVGLGAFADLMWSFYPIAVYATDDVGHAHNFFMQTALDFGIPGLVMVLAFYLTAFAQVVFVWGRGDFLNRMLATGFLGSLVGQSMFSQLDAVALGTKYNLFFWYLFALIFGAANLAARNVRAASAGRVEEGLGVIQARGEWLPREVVEEPFVSVGD
jgi:putative inorganic carbon (HCO3(-)) transporter